jgi:hypothetical protein
MVYLVATLREGFMTDSQFWMLWPDNAALSFVVLLIVAMGFFYAARRSMHQLIRSLGHATAGPLRIGARWLLSTAQAMNQRNKAVLLAHGQQEIGQRLEREFERVSAVVARDLQGYPALQRKLLDEITRIEEDYKKCGEVPPPAPDWVDAVKGVADIKSSGNEMVQSILKDIQKSVNTIHDKALSEYRKSYESRHKILASFMPFWRSVDKTLTTVDKKLVDLQDAGKSIDGHMKKYEQIAAKTDKAEHALAVSALTQFCIALIVMLVAVGGAFINFKLIALPMSEMVGAGDYLTSSLRTSDVAALVIILVEVSMGLFLMETLRITHLFPVIANLNDRSRRRMMWVSLTLLVILATVEAALALMRDMLIADKQALVQSLATVQQVAVSDGWVAKIPTAGQMLLGFILPFALTFVAVPLESLIHSSRSVGGVALTSLVRALALLLRVLGNVVRHASRVLIHMYDVFIVVPLLIERLVNRSRGRGKSRAGIGAHDDDDVVTAGRGR